MTKQEILSNLYKKQTGEEPLSIIKLPASGSSREYYRLSSKDESIIGAINNNPEENEAFFSFSEHFTSKKLPVPTIYSRDDEHNAYLLEDLGDLTLFDYMVEIRNNGDFPEPLLNKYKQVLTALPKFQIHGDKGLDYEKCYPRKSFDRQSMLWDLSYFKYYFLKLADAPFNEQLLENDFNTLINFLLDQQCEFFLYRDFQSRNIMVKDDDIFFIDYQGGRKGALQYDVASLLYDGKADLPQAIREELLEYYIAEVKKYINVKEELFKKTYYGYVLIRIMQAMGAYGFRGFFEKKAHFLLSIPYALENLKWILDNIQLPIEIPHLLEVLKSLPDNPKLSRFQKRKHRKSTLAVNVISFSFKKGLPDDRHGHGGGYIFDCRAIHNPGRYEEYKTLTGKDQPVIDFFAKEPEMDEFLNNVYSLVDQSVEKYEERNFTSLTVCFGCTGGQHRSVYCAEKLATHLKQKYSVQLSIWHREQD